MLRKQQLSTATLNIFGQWPQGMKMKKENETEETADTSSNINSITYEEQYLKLHGRSYILSLLLTFLFGPLGLFYSNVIAALFFTFTALILSGTILIPIIIWILSILLGFLFTSQYNDKVLLTAEFNRSLVNSRSL